MTKYGHYLAALERDCPPDWRGKFIRYKLLKKALKDCQPPKTPEAAAAADGAEPADAASAAPAAAAARADAAVGDVVMSEADARPVAAEAKTGAAVAAARLEASEASEARFFNLLKEELLKADKCFSATACAIVTGFQRIETRRRLACCLPLRLLAAGPGRYADLAERAYWCRKYARANAVALRKILKKHDKVCGGHRGRLFLQQCWRLTSGGSFLHSPLLDELKAIQDMLQEQRTQCEDIQLCEVADISVKGGSMGCSGAGATAAAAAGGGGGAMAGGADFGAGAAAAAVALKAAPPAPPSCAASASSTAHTHVARGGRRHDSASSAGLTANTGGGLAAAPHACCPSHAAQHREAQVLSAIMESPRLMLSSSDYEWAEGGGGGGSSIATLGGGTAMAPGLQGVAGSAGGGGARHVHLRLRRPSVDVLSLSGTIPLSISSSGGGGCGGAFSPGTSPPGPCFSPGTFPPTSPAVAAGAAAGGGNVAGASGAPLGRQLSASRFTEEDLRCPICLDTMYKPVGLACGHKFCKRCALEHAGLRRAIGTFTNLCSYVASTVACPQCRQPAVYRNAVRMRQLDRVLKLRYPQDWAERRAEERAHERAVVEAASSASPPPRLSWLNTINARDVLLAL